MRIECEAALAELGRSQQREGNAVLNADAARGQPVVAPAASIGDLMKTFVAMLQVMGLIPFAPCT
jgi:hypothetical protein